MTSVSMALCKTLMDAGAKARCHQSIFRRVRHGKHMIEATQEEKIETPVDLAPCSQQCPSMRSGKEGETATQEQTSD